jgi:putative ABC transport system permease protein
VLKTFLLTLRLGFFSLLLHKLRAGLAVLGILIGVTAVIWLVALGEGISHEAQRQIKDLGANNIIVRSIKPPQTSSTAGSFVLVYGLEYADYERIAALPKHILKQVVPMREFRYPARYDENEVEVQFVGCTPEYRELNRLEVDLGRFLESQDERDVAAVCVLGAETAEKLFLNRYPIGENVLVNGTYYRVVGVTKSREATAAIGGSLDSRTYNLDIYIPLATWRHTVGDVTSDFGSGSSERIQVELSQVTLTVHDVDDVDQVAALVHDDIARYHDKTDFAVVVPKELLRQAEMLRMMFNILLIIIAGISLLVGGIGIMNIMLATVTERTREIGIRRALGATRGDIILQFLIESLVLTGIGGMLGVIFGVACGPVVGVVRLVVERFPEVVAAIPKNILGITPMIAPWSIAVAFLISVSVGLIFGLYPAYRAAMMDPIEALRHE